MPPELSLVHSSGRGNGVFGSGWSLSVPASRQGYETKDVPVYIADLDHFSYPTHEQLVPTAPSADSAMSYWPRIEGMFARIKHHTSPLDDHWEVRSRDGLKSLYGHSGFCGAHSATLRNPDPEQLVFSSEQTETTDTFGNRIVHIYERDASPDDGPHHSDQIYLKTTRYIDYGSKDSPTFLATGRPAVRLQTGPLLELQSWVRDSHDAPLQTKIELHTHADASPLARAYHLTYQNEEQPSVMPTKGASLLP